ncbi:MAG TPA: hypothetical protein VFR35_16870, partial [Actinoplanes sp.]|nr:hypothetical protein [Actinoplanes sp.]
LAGLRPAGPRLLRRRATPLLSLTRLSLTRLSLTGLPLTRLPLAGVSLAGTARLPVLAGLGATPLLLARRRAAVAGRRSLLAVLRTLRSWAAAGSTRTAGTTWAAELALLTAVRIALPTTGATRAAGTEAAVATGAGPARPAVPTRPAGAAGTGRREAALLARAGWREPTGAGRRAAAWRRRSGRGRRAGRDDLSGVRTAVAVVLVLVVAVGRGRSHGYHLRCVAVGVGWFGRPGR